MEDIYYINLDRSPDRKEAMENIFFNKNYNLKRFRAIDGSQIHNIHITNLRKQSIIPYSLSLDNINQKRGRFGTMLSHIYLWELLKKEKKNYGIILEDDISINEHFDTILKTVLNNLPERWDIIYLGYDGVYKSTFLKYNSIYNIPTLDSKYYGMWGYIINIDNLENIKKILFPVSPELYHFDNYLRKHASNLLFYFLNQRIIIHKDEYSIRQNIDTFYRINNI